MPVARSPMLLGRAMRRGLPPGLDMTFTTTAITFRAATPASPGGRQAISSPTWQQRHHGQRHSLRARPRLPLRNGDRSRLAWWSSSSGCADMAQITCRHPRRIPQAGFPGEGNRRRRRICPVRSRESRGGALCRHCGFELATAVETPPPRRGRGPSRPRKARSDSRRGADRSRGRREPPAAAAPEEAPLVPEEPEVLRRRARGGRAGSDSELEEPGRARTPGRGAP